MGAAPTGADLEISPPMTCSFPFPSMAPRCCLIDSCRRKYDLSRAGGGNAPGSPAGAGNDRPEPPGSAGSGGWHAASVPVSSGAGTHPRSRPAPDSRNRRCKTSTRNPNHGKTTAVTPLLWPSHPARVWNNGPLSWQAGYAVVVPSNRGRHKKTPDRCRDRGFPFA